MKPEVYKMWNNTLNSVLNEQFLKKRVYGHMMGLVAGTKYVCICACIHIYMKYIHDTYICAGQDCDFGRKTRYMFAKCL